MTSSRSRSTGSLGTAVVLVFLLGLVSAPLRSCLSHPGHDHLAAGLASETQPSLGVGPQGHTGHDTSPPSGEAPGERAPAGCDCLGLCQLETSPMLVVEGTVAYAIEPGFVELSWIGADVTPTRPSTPALPLARGPPKLL